MKKSVKKGIDELRKEIIDFLNETTQHKGYKWKVGYYDEIVKEYENGGQSEETLFANNYSISTLYTLRNILHFLTELIEDQKTYGQKTYATKKEEIRNQAIEWSQKWSDESYSWAELAEYQAYFYTMGKRYGLLREFHENAICWKSGGI